MSANVKEISSGELAALLKEGKTVVCDFWASWCGPCRMLAPIMDEAAGEFSDRAVFVKVDVDANPEAAMKYGVMSIPYVVILRGDDLLASSIGYQPIEELRVFLDANL